MQVNVNIPKRYMIIISICIFIGLIVCISCIAHRLNATKHYQCTKGEILSVRSELVYEVGAKNRHKYFKAEIEYEVDNRKYYSSQYSTLKFGWKEGKRVKVYYDPSNPEITRENNKTLMFVTLAIGAMFLFSILLVKNAKC